MRKNKNTKIILLGIFIVIAFMGIIASGSVTKDIQFVNFIQAERPEQDVFIQKEELGPDQVMRVEGNDTDDPDILSEMVYTTAIAIHHDPFKVSDAPLGPFAMGEPLGFTLGEWLNAKGSGTYTIDGESAEMDFSFQNLLPNGTYTLWCSRVTLPPNQKFVDLPCGAQDGSENVLMADAQGNSDINITLKTLTESSTETRTVIALAYHSDGKTHGDSPGDFGLNSHVQLLYMMPPPTEPEPMLISNEPEPTVISTEPEPTPDAPGFGGLFAMGILVILYFMGRKG
ncbi:MAG: hypothetical protein KAH86_07020 [Methanosarcinales archaeon]|nr:hypothetical protein [Methanosarcinales archaeon]